MTIRTLLTPVMVFGLAGAAIYYAPCLSGDCGEAATVADGEDEATPCDKPCPGKAKKAKTAEPAPEALAAVEDEDPCPYARGEEPCDGKKGADAPDASALAAAEQAPEPAELPEQPDEAADPKS